MAKTSWTGISVLDSYYNGSVNGTKVVVTAAPTLIQSISVLNATSAEAYLQLFDKATGDVTVGSTAPFIGLFGTVWGIMNSFQSIAISRNTSLAIVAPGIAEALFATALGLLAAIPAVVAFNKFSSDSKKYSQKLESFSKRFISIV